LLGKHSNNWTMPLVLLLLVYFSYRVSLTFPQAGLQSWDPPTSASWIVGITDMHHHNQLLLPSFLKETPCSPKRIGGGKKTPSWLYLEAVWQMSPVSRGHSCHRSVLSYYL
jgi:hypothetical protein